MPIISMITLRHNKITENKSGWFKAIKITPKSFWNSLTKN